MQKLSKEEIKQNYTTFQEFSCKGACRVCGDWWTDLSSKNYWFPKHKDYPTVKKMDIKGTSIYPKALMKGHSMRNIY